MLFFILIVVVVMIFIIVMSSKFKQKVKDLEVEPSIDVPSNLKDELEKAIELDKKETQLKEEIEEESKLESNFDKTKFKNNKDVLHSVSHSLSTKTFG